MIARWRQGGKRRPFMNGINAGTAIGEAARPTHLTCELVAPTGDRTSGGRRDAVLAEF